VEYTTVPGEIHQPFLSHWQTSFKAVLSAIINFTFMKRLKEKQITLTLILCNRLSCVI
jgi:hypothetical protein